MKTFFLTLLLCLSTTLFAREVKLATITGNVDTDTSLFQIEVTEAGLIDSVHFTTTTREGRVTQDSFFPAQTVIDVGVVLLERNGRDILRLEAEKTFSQEKGGIVKLNYLYSGVTGSRKTLKVSLTKNGEEFEIHTLTGEKVTRFYTKGNWHPILGLIGISELEPRP